MLDESEEIKEVYARFGLATYFTQVLEHGLVNALLILDLIPSRRHLTRSRIKWGTLVDTYMDQHFDTTMGQLMQSLKQVTVITPELEERMRGALKRRNKLAHRFFREHSQNFMTSEGRKIMLTELDECRDYFKKLDSDLSEIIRPLRLQYGITDELIEQEFNYFEKDPEGI